MKKSLKALFFPWAHGAGFGYIGRALKIAEEMRTAGHECFFACDTEDGLIARCGFAICRENARHGRAVQEMHYRRGHYIPIDNLDTAFGIAGYYHSTRVMEHIQQDLAVLERVGPDLVVIDMQPTAAIASRHSGVPLVSACDSDFLRTLPNGWMPWLSPQEACILPYPSCVPAFNSVLSEFSQPQIGNVTELLWGDLTLVASVPELETNQAPIHPIGRLQYVGPIWWDPPWSQARALLCDHGRDAKRVYITLGHGGKNSNSQIQSILDACARGDHAVFLSVGLDKQDVALRFPSNVRYDGFTGITDPISWSDVVIHHGGYSTTLVSLLYGKPAIVVPFMSEQEANGLFFVEKQGAGFLIRRTYADSQHKRHFRHRLRYSGYVDDDTLPSHEFEQALIHIFAAEYSEAALRLADLIRSYLTGRSLSTLVASVI